MHPEEPAAKLPGSASLFAVAGAVASVEERQVLLLQDLIGMEARQWGLGCANQHRVFALDEVLVALLVALGCKARTTRHAATHHVRHRHGAEAFAHKEIKSVLVNGILEQHEVAQHIVKLCASYLSTALEVEPAPARGEVEVILSRLTPLTPLLDLHTVCLTAQWDVWQGDVWHCLELSKKVVLYGAQLFL